MTGLLGYGGCWEAINHADVLLMLGTDFPFSPFLPHKNVRIIQIDRTGPAWAAGSRSRSAPSATSGFGDSIVALVEAKPRNGLLDRCVKMTEHFHAKMRHFVDKGHHIKPIRPEYLAATLNTLAADDALFFADTGTAIIWAARLIEYGAHRRLFGSFSWASMANASPNAFGAQTAFPGRQTIALCGDGGFTMLALGDLLTEVERRAHVVHVVLNNGGLGVRKDRTARGGCRPLWDRVQEPQLRRGGRGDGGQGHPGRGPGRRGRRESRQHSSIEVVRWCLMSSSTAHAIAVPSHIPCLHSEGLHPERRQGGPDRPSRRCHRDGDSQSRAPLRLGKKGSRSCYGRPSYPSEVAYSDPS